MEAQNMSKWSNPVPKEGDKSSFKLSEESATACVRELLDFYHLNVGDIEDPASKNSFELSLNKLQNAYRRGALENKMEKGSLKIIQHLDHAPGDLKEITYDELQGKYKPAMDAYESKETYKRQFALLGALSGLGQLAIESLRGTDLSIAECLSFFFLMV